LLKASKSEFRFLVVTINFIVSDLKVANMKKFIIIVIGIALLYGITGTGSMTFFPEGEDERLDRMQNAFFAAVAAQDTDKILELFAESAVVHIANRPPIEGREAIGQFYSTLFGFLSASTALQESINISESGDMAYSFGRTINEFRDPQGTIEYTGKYILIWEKHEGEWMIILYGISSNQPDPIR
jgi:ketosteroid isomerase-like protein